jgi:hypothetical protein
VAALSVALAGCSDAAGDRAPSPEGGAPSLELPPCEATFESLRDDVFARACDAEYCHGAVSSAWDLWLLAPDAEQTLLSRRAGTCPDHRLVVPGDPAESFLYLKVSEDHPPCGTERMPRGALPLPRHSIDCIRGWIEALPGP